MNALPRKEDFYFIIAELLEYKSHKKPLKPGFSATVLFTWLNYKKAEDL